MGEKTAWPFNPLAKLVPAELAHRPIFRWRWPAYGEKRPAGPWQYVDPEDYSIIACRLYERIGGIEVEPVTAETLRDAIDDAFDAGAAFEKFGNPADDLFRRLNYRRCSRKRAWPRNRPPRVPQRRFLVARSEDNAGEEYRGFATAMRLTPSANGSIIVVAEDRATLERAWDQVGRGPIDHALVKPVAVLLDAGDDDRQPWARQLESELF